MSQNKQKETTEGLGEDKPSPNRTPKSIAGVNSDRDSDTSAGTQGTAETISAGINKLGLQKKQKLSGAQYRKLRKAEKIAAGTWIKENPHKKDHSKKEPEKGGDGPSRGKNLIRDKTGPKGGKQEGGEGREGKKRPRDESHTPKKTSKKPRSYKKPTGPYSEAVSGLRMAVIDKRHPEVTLEQGQADLIQNKLVDRLDCAPSGSNNPIQFTRTTFSGGVLWMTCANEFTKTWLRETVGTLGNLWEGADLTAVESKDLPKRPRVLVSIPGAEEPEEAVRTRLGRQNPGLRVGGWLLLSRKVEEEVSILAYSIDEASFGVLETNRFRAYYRLGRVIFRVLKGLDGGDQGASSEPPTQ